ncbi:hypothetical protein EVAR_27447_1 [Eumeta japonica]|uniref:Uncharacterized protein n=1 Tax=Eumeta variegata TaxID=151549 RepID=A0A4C1VLB4_EUMVA|nr:hypothetical protein EVAR_27447_1 [Eumeta japonica]
MRWIWRFIVYACPQNIDITKNNELTEWYLKEDNMIRVMQDVEVLHITVFETATTAACGAPPGGVDSTGVAQQVGAIRPVGYSGPALTEPAIR